MSLFLFLFFILFLVVIPYFTFAITFAPITTNSLWLSLSWVTLVFILAYTEISKIPGEDDYGILMAILIFNIVMVCFFFIIKITRTDDLHRNKSHNKLEESHLTEYLKYITFSLYGVTTVYVLTTFNGDILVGWQPGLIAYLFVILCIAIVWYIPYFVSLEAFENPEKIQMYLRFFTCSFSVTMLSLLIFSLSFPSQIIHKAHQVINDQRSSDSPYCIQVVNYRWKKGYKPLSTFLDLSPLTIRLQTPLGSWYGWGDPYFHALLILRSQDQDNLYNWSYKQRKWSYLETGFEERQSIEKPEIICIPQENFLEGIPWIFPKK